MKFGVFSFILGILTLVIYQILLEYFYIHLEPTVILFGFGGVFVGFVVMVLENSNKK